MSEFVSLEEAAEQLKVSDVLVRQWIRRGLARASRRGGDYYLRVTEVERLRQSTDLDHHISKDPPTLSIEGEEPRKPKVRPPRSEKNPQGFSGEKDRRRRMGRRASDFTLEILHQEILSAMNAALSPLLPKLEEFTERLGSTGAAAPVQEDSDQLILLQRVDLLENENLQIRERQSHLEQAREEYRGRLQASEEVRLGLEQELMLLRQAQAQREGTSANLEALQQEVARERTLRFEREESMKRLEEQILRQRQEMLQANMQRESFSSNVEAVQQELARERALRMEQEAHLKRLEEELLGHRSEMERQQGLALAAEAERATWDYESRSLQGEIDRLNSMKESWEDERHQFEVRLKSYEQRLSDAERHGNEAVQRQQEQEAEREAELRRLREQVNSLTYRLQMAGPGSAGPSTEDSRRLLERLAEAEAQMAQKDQLITQNYGEISELGSKLEAAQRNYYELDQRYERLRDEWSQLAAKQMTEFQQQKQNQAPVDPGPPPERNKGWGGLFRMRGE